MDRKTCNMCFIKKYIDDFYNKLSECKICNSDTGLKRYYENGEKYQINEKYNRKKLKINYYRNKVIDIYILKNYSDPMLN